ncbi:MAG: hypothetical protein LBW85_08720, partial [Deltaproteobacteria bacterium]|nr:hypothetical protein [Deltaproteobacteria bacterium]
MIVEFLEGNLFLDGWVLDASASGGRLEVLAGGRVFKLHPKRVLVSSEAADPGNREGRCALLEARGAARAELAGKIDLSVVWELLEEEHAAPEAAQDNEAPAGAGPAPDGGAPAGARPAPDGGAVAGARPAADGGASADGASGDAGPAVHAGHASQAEPADQAAPEGAAGETAGSARNEPRRAGSEAHSPYPYGALAEIEFGRGAGPDETAAVIRAVHGDGLYFKFTPEAALKRSREEIARILEDRARAARRAEQRREGILWLKSAREAYFGDTSETKAAAPAHGRGPVGPASDRRPLDASAQAPPAAFSRSAASSPHAAGPAYATPAAPPASPPAGPPAPRREVIPPPPDDGGELVRSLTELALCVEDPPPSHTAASEALSEAGFPADPAGDARALEA